MEEIMKLISLVEKNKHDFSDKIEQSKSITQMYVQFKSNEKTEISRQF